MRAPLKSLMIVGLAAVSFGGVASTAMAGEPIAVTCGGYPPQPCPGPQTVTPAPPVVPTGDPDVLTATGFVQTAPDTATLRPNVLTTTANVFFTLELVPPAAPFVNSGNSRPKIVINAGNSPANASGVAVLNIIAPAVGVYTVKATQTIGNTILMATNVLTVTDKAAGPVPPTNPPVVPPAAPIPETGSNVAGILQIGGITLLVGAGLAVAAASRRKRPIAA